MRKNFGAKPNLYPMPVFILAAYDEAGKPCAMNAAWGGQSGASEVFVCLSPGHKTTKNILASGAFTLSIGTEKELVACDYVGIVSGNDVEDKMEKAGWHTEKSEFVNAPIIKELGMTFECRLKSYDEKSHHLFGEIVNISVEEDLLNEAGVVDVAKLRPISYDPMNHDYLLVATPVGKAFSDGNKLK